MTMLLAAPFLAVSCIEDNGTYDYVETPEITITGIPEVTEVLAHVDNIKMNPIITSSTEGQITPDNPNYTIQYRFGHKGMGSMGVDSVAMRSIAFKDVTPASGFNLDTPADYNPGLYIIWLTLTDNRTGVVTSKQYDVSIGSTTYEGWLVLCNEGSEERVRLDMISRISADRTEAIYDVCAGLPNIHHATTVNMFPSNGGEMAVFSKEGAYALVRLPSGEMRKVPINAKASIGQVSNIDHENVNYGKAGRVRNMGWRPTVRGSVMNPCDHPHGGGEGKSPVGRPGPVTPWGKPALGYKTRKKHHRTDKFIVKRRNGK